MTRCGNSTGGCGAMHRNRPHASPRGRHALASTGVCHRRPKVGLAGTAVVVIVGLAVTGQHAIVYSAFSGRTHSPGNKWSAATLAPPTNFTATINCAAASAPAYRAGTTAKNGVSPVTSITMTVPSAAVTGDLLLADVSWNVGDSATVTPPTGWTLVRKELADSSSGNWLYSRLATPSDPGKTYTWASDIGSQASGTIVAYSGVNTTNPFDAPVASASAVTGPTTITAPSVTAATAPTTLVTFFSVKQGGTINAPAGMTTRQTAFNAVSLAVFEQTITTTGATGTRTTNKSSSSPAEGITVLLRGQATPTANLAWTKTTTAGATGYQLRRNGGAPTAITPASTTSTTDGPLTPSTAVTWTLVTTAGTNWTSTAATASATAAQTTC